MYDRAKKNLDEHIYEATQQMAWVQHMNMLKAQAEEIVLNDLIYC